MTAQEICIIGGGLAGCEAAWQAAKRGCRVSLYEMKPQRFSPAHHSPQLAELVCSNSLRSADSSSAVGILKEEMHRLESLIMDAALHTRVPAGKALAVDRVRFAELITRMIEEHPLITIFREEAKEIPPSSDTKHDIPVIIATGPLTSQVLVAQIAELAGSENLAFYDAIAPIVSADSLNYDSIYRASRYDDGPGDYLNCPLNREQYEAFIAVLKKAEKVVLRSFEGHKYFEGCLPIEVMLERGDDTPRFGPMKPVGLPDPHTGHVPYAVVQLRQENSEGTSYNMVGFQTKLTYPEQRRVFSMIPGLENVEFLRMGSIHRNTFVCAPEVLTSFLQFRSRKNVFLAGQLTGVEGYVESSAMGLLAGINAARTAQGGNPVIPPPDTAHGALITHLTNAAAKHFQPSNINFGLFPALTKKIPKKLRGKYRAEKARESLEQWIKDEELLPDN